MMDQTIKGRADSFAHAFAGSWFVFHTQRNVWIHGFFTLTVFIIGIFLRISLSELVIIILAIALVWTAEFFDTALEATIDLANPQTSYLAKIG